MISIITPAHIDSIEKLEWLNEMIKSVQAQSLTEWELILVDDASPITVTLQEPDNRIRYFRTTYRSGPSLTRNTAVALSRYDALLPVDADDILATPDTLKIMYNAWEKDKTKIVYGDIQRLELWDGVWRKGRVFELPEYTFAKIMDLGGIIPVTAMHSIDCHVKAGGWKANLEAGLEDVEYWISAGKAGFCGERIVNPGMGGNKTGEVILLYRKHENSRSTQLMQVNRRKGEMQNLIREMHSDVYEGKFPMGCCGGGAAYIPPSTFTQQTEALPSRLDQYSTEQKVWVEYTGLRTGSFGVVGPFTNIAYNVDGLGHKLEVHINDLSIFRRRRGPNGGEDFAIGVPPPNGFSQQPKQQNGTTPPFQAGQPAMAEILRLDEIAAK